MADDTSRALVPIAEAVPELRAEQYANVREWDAEILAADEAHEVYTGERLAKIQAELAPKGLFGAYLRVRGIPETTARRRIAVSQGRTDVYKRRALAANAGSLEEPDPMEIYERAKREAAQLALGGDYQAAERRLSEAYEAGHGIYLAKIRAVLAPKGRWETYLLARSLDPRTVEKHLRAAAAWK